MAYTLKRVKRDKLILDNSDSYSDNDSYSDSDETNNSDEDQNKEYNTTIKSVIECRIDANSANSTKSTNSTNNTKKNTTVKGGVRKEKQMNSFSNFLHLHRYLNQ